MEFVQAPIYLSACFTRIRLTREMGKQLRRYLLNSPKHIIKVSNFNSNFYIKILLENKVSNSLHLKEKKKRNKKCSP